MQVIVIDRSTFPVVPDDRTGSLNPCRVHYVTFQAFPLGCRFSFPALFVEYLPLLE